MLKRNVLQIRCRNDGSPMVTSSANGGDHQNLPELENGEKPLRLNRVQVAAPPSPAAPMPWQRSWLLQKYASPQIAPSLPLGQAPHAVWWPPCRAAASRFHIPIFHATFVPMRFCGLPHTGHLPIGIAVSPYGHTPDASPHTSRQIPIGKPSPHTVSADPPYNPQSLKN